MEWRYNNLKNCDIIKLKDSLLDSRQTADLEERHRYFNFFKDSVPFSVKAELESLFASMSRNNVDSNLLKRGFENEQESLTLAQDPTVIMGAFDTVNHLDKCRLKDDFINFVNFGDATSLSESSICDICSCLVSCTSKSHTALCESVIKNILFPWILEKQEVGIDFYEIFLKLFECLMKEVSEFLLVPLLNLKVGVGVVFLNKLLEFLNIEMKQNLIRMWIQLNGNLNDCYLPFFEILLKEKELISDKHMAVSLTSKLEVASYGYENSSNFGKVLLHLTKNLNPEYVDCAVLLVLENLLERHNSFLKALLSNEIKKLKAKC